jgi:hypothetical protein
VLGSTGAFASYKGAFFVVLIALVDSDARLSVRQAASAAAVAVLIIYMSLVWSVVKVEYRAQIVWQGPLASVSWLAGKYFGGDVDLAQGASILVERVGYTKFYGMVLDLDTSGFRGIYLRALEHVLTPRILFPEKAALSDSAESNQILGWNISQGTSVGIGYVAEALVDFGFPGLLVPVFGLGTLVGLIYCYFISRNSSLVLKRAIAVACLFDALAFERDINKQLGGILMGFIVLALCLKYGGQWVIHFVSIAPAARRAV